MSPNPACQRTTAKTRGTATPEIHSTVFPDTRVVPAPTRTRCRPKTQPSTITASHGKIGYLMLRVSLP
jgi:hypothetical protein